MQKEWNDIIEKISSANRDAAQSALEFNRIALRTHGELVQRQMAAVESCLDATAEQFRAITDSRDPQEAVKKLSEVSTNLGEKLVNSAQESLEVQIKARDEVSTWFEDKVKYSQAQMNDTVETFSKAAKSASKKAASKIKAA